MGATVPVAGLMPTPTHISDVRWSRYFYRLVTKDTVASLYIRPVVPQV